MPTLIGDKPLTPAEKSRRWREKHPERARESWQRWQKENPEKQKENSRRSYAKNVESERAKDSAWRSANRDLQRERARASYWKQPEKQRQRRHLRRVSESQFIILSRELKKIYRDPCVKCGCLENQSLDHIVPLSRGGRHTVGNIQTLCLSCNISKANRTMMEWRLGHVARRRREVA